MSLFLNFNGCLDVLDVLRLHWLNTLQVGLFQNDIDPFDVIQLSHLEVCDFSGYIGYRTPSFWPAAAMVGERATSFAPEILWAHNGGPTANLVYGWFAINPVGKLVIVEPREDGPQEMSVATDVYRVVPGFTQRSEFS